jgi:FKBP-type peptidyl-prolyl cis-trans isomerase FkpA
MKLLSFPLAAAFAAVLSLSACGGGGDSGSNTTSPAATVKITDTVVGTGTQAGANSHVLVNYTGWLYSATAVGNKGTQFDTSVGRGAFDFTIGGNVIPGFSQGVTGMKEGGKRTIVIPAVLGYGATGAPGIPPNTDLVFDVELVKVCGATC